MNVMTSVCSDRSRLQEPSLERAWSLAAMREFSFKEWLPAKGLGNKDRTDALEKPVRMDFSGISFFVFIILVKAGMLWLMFNPM